MAEETIKLYDGERIDRLGYQGLQIIQDPQKFKFTMDAFLLAAFIEPRSRQRILDLGTGGGVLPLLIAGQKGGAAVERIVGIEIQPELALMAERSVTLNGLGNKITILPGDLRNLPEELKPNSFDYVIANPPFFPVAKGVISENTALATAKFEICCNLDDVIKAASRMVKGNGKVALIYPADRLTDLLMILQKHHLTPKRLRLIYPRVKNGSNLVLVEGRPGAKGGLDILPALVVYGEDGNYTPEMQAIFNGT